MHSLNSLLASLALSLAAAAQTTAKVPLLPQAWDHSFGYAGFSSPAEEMVIFDDGDGPKLYACGGFYLAGNVIAEGLARWDGMQWESVQLFPGASLGTVFTDLVVHDDGSGPRLFVSSQVPLYSSSIGGVAAWDGATWEVFPATGVGNYGVFDLHSDGSTLYAGGRMGTLGGIGVKNIARYDGTRWHSMGFGAGQGVPYTVLAIAVSDAEGSSTVYAGCTGGGNPAGTLFRWDATAWTPVTSVNSAVWALAHFPSAAGPQLVIAEPGSPLQALSASGLTLLNGTAPLGVRSLKVETEAGVSNLFAMGDFKTIGSLQVEGLARWNGSSWFAVGGAPFNLGTYGWIHSMVSADLGGGFERFVSGDFDSINGTVMRKVTSLSSGVWNPLGREGGTRNLSTTGSVSAIAEFDDGSGRDIYIGGTFDEVGGSGAMTIARRDGDQWEALGSPPPFSNITCFEVFDDGTGESLYVGGDSSPGIARWDGTAWSSVHTGLTGSVRDLEVYDDGQGPALFVGGTFSEAGSVPVQNLARWDGTSWSSIGDVGPTFAYVSSIEVFDDGTGARLYVGGSFTQVAGMSANSIAAWDGTSWDPMINGVNGRVTQLLATDLPEAGGARLLVAGFMTGGITRWTGSAWHKSFGFPPKYGNTMAVWDDGTGSRLYAQAVPVGTRESLLYTLLPTGWELLERTTASYGTTVNTMFADSDPEGSSLWVGGSFVTMDEKTASVGIARRSRELAPFAFQTTPVVALGLTQSPNLSGEFDPSSGEAVVRIDDAPATGEALFFIGTETKTSGHGLAVEALWHHRIALGANTAELRGSLPRDLPSSGLFVQALVREPGMTPRTSSVLRITATGSE